MVLAAWKAHPAANRPRDVFLLVAVLFLFCGAVLSVFQSAFLAVLAAVVLLVSVSAFWLPTRYELTDDELIERRLLVTRSRRWADLRRAEIGPGAALLSPFAKPSVLDRYRGLFVLLDGADREEVVRIIRERVPGEAQS